MKYLLTLLTMSLLVACYSENEEELFPEPPAITDSTVVSFQMDVLPIIQQNCTNNGCHVPNGSGPGFLRNYMEIKGMQVNGGKLKNRAVTLRNMPSPNGIASDDQVNKLATWIERGMPNN